MSAAPTSGRKVAQLRTWLSNMSESLLADEEVEDDDGEAAGERAVEVGLDAAGLDAPQRAAALDGGVRHRVHRAVDDVLVDGVVEVADRAADPAREVHDVVDDL